MACPQLFPAAKTDSVRDLSRREQRTGGYRSWKTSQTVAKGIMNNA